MSVVDARLLNASRARAAIVNDYRRATFSKNRCAQHFTRSSYVGQLSVQSGRDIVPEISRTKSWLCV